MEFTDKAAVVTGGARGIGRSLAQALKERGARTAVIDLLEDGPDCDYFLRGDVADPGTLEAFASECLARFGRIDILVNNAMLTRGGLADCGYDDFLYVQRVGVAAPYYLTRLLAPGFSEGASVLNLSSTRAFQSQRDTESYSAAKGGITALTHALALSLSGRARVNAIAPGWIDTLREDHPGPDSSQHPAGRVGCPQDIVEAALFLLSPRSGFITGETLVVDGGMSRQMIYHGDGGWTLA